MRHRRSSTYGRFWTSPLIRRLNQPNHPVGAGCRNIMYNEGQLNIYSFGGLQKWIKLWPLWIWFLIIFLEVMNFDEVGPRNYDTNWFSHHQPIDLSLSEDRLIPQLKKLLSSHKRNSLSPALRASVPISTWGKGSLFSSLFNVFRWEWELDCTSFNSQSAESVNSIVSR